MCIRDRYTGMSLSVEYLGKLAGPVMGGLLADWFFIKAPFFVSMAILLFLILLIPREKKHRHVRKRDLNPFSEMRRFLHHRELRGMAILGIVMHATFPAFTIFLPLLIVEKMGLGYSYVGYAYFALGATHILQFLFGKWSDRKPYRVVLAGTIISGVFMILMSSVNIYSLLLVLLFLKGTGNSLWNISAWTLMSRIGEREEIEGSVIGSYISIAKIGSFVSFLLSGFVVQVYGIGFLFLVNGLLVILESLAAYPMLREITPPRV